MLQSSHTIYVGVLPYIYSTSSFSIHYPTQRSLQPLRNLSPNAFASLRHLTFHLNVASCEASCLCYNTFHLVCDVRTLEAAQLVLAFSVDRTSPRKLRYPPRPKTRPFPPSNPRSRYRHHHHHPHTTLLLRQELRKHILSFTDLVPPPGNPVLNHKGLLHPLQHLVLRERRLPPHTSPVPAPAATAGCAPSGK